MNTHEPETREGGMSDKSNEFDIRSAVVSRLLSDGIPRGDIRIEIPLDMASSEGRADIVVLTNKIRGIELKSGKDKFCPVAIKAQCKQYNRAFDACGVIVDLSHRRERDEVYEHGTRHHSNWGSVEAQYCHQSKTIQNCFGEEMDNLCDHLFRWGSRKTSTYDMCLLLWGQEIKAIAGNKTGKYDFCAQMRENGKLCEVRPLVINALRGREQNKWEKAFWKRYDGVIPQDLIEMQEARIA